MADPLAVLHAPIAPADPDPAYTARLRARLERAFALPRGVLVSELSADLVTPEPSPRHGDVGYAWLSVPDLDQAITFYAAALGWTVSPGSYDQGRQVEGRTPRLGLQGAAEHATLNCCYAVEDVAAAVRRVREAGGRAGEPTSAPYGLVADCADDQGTVFALYQPPGGVGGEALGMGSEGDLVYVTLEVVDSARAREFYGSVLGWRFTPGGVEDGWQIETAMTGLHGGYPHATTLPMWRVDDITAAAERVRSAGGTSTEPQTRPYGLEAQCADDQGTRFYLGQL